MKKIQFILFASAVITALAFTAIDNEQLPPGTAWAFIEGDCIRENIDGGFNCYTSTGSITCKVQGNDAYNTQTNCMICTSVGLLKRDP